jgi:hypothetical protein
VRLSVPRNGGVRTWGAVSGEFDRRLGEQESSAVIAAHRVSVQEGRDYVRVTVALTVAAPDMAEALDQAWWGIPESRQRRPGRLGHGQYHR